MISTHILDTSLGNPAEGVDVELSIYNGQEWEIIDSNKTNSDGRIIFNCPPKIGTYKIKFKIENYFIKKNIEPFFLVAPIVFKISDTGRKYHIPLLLNPFGYSTYRGS